MPELKGKSSINFEEEDMNVGENYLSSRLKSNQELITILGT